ncbi:MAG TPA: hypothetical protein VKR42_03100 [Ktedonobacteraceae bacterium]|nr:hypothetical protein [Ktedonobacteraceae bacterium]
MARKDSEKDADRPHYYSQFWLDVAAGRRIIGVPRTDEGDTDEGLEPVAPRRPVRSTVADSDGYHETVVHPQVDPEALEEDADEYSIPDVDSFDVGDDNEIEEEDNPTFGANEDDIPDLEIAPQEVETAEDVEVEEVEPKEIEEAEAETEDFFDEEEEEEDEDTWSARGRKKPKPGRQVKLPTKTPPKRAKREPRRGF